MTFRVGDQVRFLGCKPGEVVPIDPETVQPGTVGIITWISDPKGGLRFRFGVQMGEDGTTVPLAEHEIEHISQL